MSQSPLNFDQTRAAQWRASNPAVSAWVSANAGSGKTHVLSQRVLRLLLQGVPPAKIVCLTYTKAAAANMALKVFSTLAQWTGLSDKDLRTAIADLGLTHALDAQDLRLARRLFARTVETPGGLKIQTLHAFCERLLHVFPFEAGVAASFTVMEDEDVQLALATACDDVIEAAQKDAVLSGHLMVMAAALDQQRFKSIMAEMLSKRQKIQAMLRHGGVERYVQELRHWLDLPPDFDRATLEARAIDFCIPRAQWKYLADALMTGSSEDHKKAKLFYRADSLSDLRVAAEVLHDVFFDAKGEPRNRLMTKKVQSAFPDLHALMLDEQQRMIGFDDQQRRYALLERTHALIAVFEHVASAYRRYKALRGTLDFDDLISRTVDLLSRSTAAQWVLYKLDSGIDHILVDEAQDTSPEQWQILEAISQDFTAGFGQRPQQRSFFAVGDEKQSIYSFQGAEPDKFSTMRQRFQKRIRAAELPFESVPLHMSFRSAPGILASVDCIFAHAQNRDGLSSDDVALVHSAWKTQLPSHVELWPVIEKSSLAHDEGNWLLPVDALDKNDPIVILSHRIANQIAALIAPDSSDTVSDKNGHARPIHAGDIMILVRKRGPIFNAIIRALKEHNVPVAGADRLELTDHLAVMDLIALGRAVLLPLDDLSLACLLKSPFFDMSDDDLIALAPMRGDSSLWQALAQSPDPRHRAHHKLLEEWRGRAHNSTPFEFYAYMLNVMGGRRRLMARLGAEANDAVDEFLRLALNYERNQPASLVGFLNAIDGADLSIKRDMEAAGGYVRVMTAHAAKGLEAKIVFVPDSVSSPHSRGFSSKHLLSHEHNGVPLLFWTAFKADPSHTQPARDAAAHAQEQEHRRLLYVALTRAEERLYIMGAGQVQSGSWYEMINASLAPSMNAVPAPWDDNETILQTRHLAFTQSAAPSAQAQTLTPDDAPLPAWINTPAPFEQQAEPPLSPSHAVAGADQFDKMTLSPEDVAQRALYGRLMHVLVQYLPQCPLDQRAHAAQHFIDQRAGALPEAQRQLLRDEALALFDDPAMRALAPYPRQSEVALAGRIIIEGREIRLAGQIDALIDTPEALVVIDYKTGAVRDGSHVPQAYAAQLGLYRRLLMQLYPQREVRCYLVYTGGPHLVELSPAVMEKALSKIRA